MVSGTGGFISNLRGLGWPVVAERSKQKRDGLSAFDVLIIERAGAAGGAGQSWGNGAAHPPNYPTLALRPACISPLVPLAAAVQPPSTRDGWRSGWAWTMHGRCGQWPAPGWRAVPGRAHHARTRTRYAPCEVSGTPQSALALTAEPSQCSRPLDRPATPLSRLTSCTPTPRYVRRSTYKSGMWPGHTCQQPARPSRERTDYILVQQRHAG